MHHNYKYWSLFFLNAVAFATYQWRNFEKGNVEYGDQFDTRIVLEVFAQFTERCR